VVRKLKNLKLTAAVCVVAIVIIATFLRLYQITEFPPGLYPDEAMNGNNALEALATGDFKVFYPENNGREGLFINIQAAFLSVFGNEPWALRLPSAIFGILTILGLYLLLKQLWNKNVALLSAFFMATSFWHINFSRIGFRVIMAPFFLIWAIYLLVPAFHQSGSKKWGSAALVALAGGIFYGLGFHTYIAYRATPILILVLLFAFWGKAKKENWLPNFYKAAGIFIATTIVVTLPILYYFAAHPQDFLGRTTQVSIFSSATPVKDLISNIAQTIGMFNISGDWNWRHNIAGHPLLFWPVGIAFLLGIAVAIRKFRFPLWWFGVAALPVVVSNEGIPHALRAILMAPAVFMLAGLGGVQIYEFLKKSVSKELLTSGGCIVLGLLIVEAFLSYFIVWGKSYELTGAFSQNYVEIGRELNRLPKELPKYVVIKADGVLVRGIPMPSQTVMFITDTFTPEKQAAKNIHYLLYNQESLAPPGAYVVVIE